MKQLGNDRQAYVSVLHYIKNHPHLELYVADRIVNEDSYNFTFYGFFLP